MNPCTVIWFDRPPAEWVTGFPIGNGRLGAMVGGGVENDRIQLNEESIWSGVWQDRNNPQALTHLPQIRQALQERNFRKAEDLALRYLTGIPDSQRAYQTAGDLSIHWNLPQACAYRRSLDLETSCARVEFTAGGVHYCREYLASAADGCILIRFTADRPHAITFHADLMRKRDYTKIWSEDENSVCMEAGSGISYAAKVRAVAENGSVSTGGGAVWVDHADSALLLVDIRTSFSEKDPLALCRETLDRAAEKPAELLFSRGISDYQSFFQRMDLKLDAVEGLSCLPVDRRLEALAQGRDDPSLYALLFHFGRYLMISGSRAGGLPLTLQGIWNQDMAPAWDSKYTININTEMNYWPVELFSLPECHRPLFDLLKRMYVHGQQTARVMYGCRGWMAHHNTDLWGDTAPQDSCTGSTHWVMGGAWLSLHIWQHYLYTLDRDFLEEFYPILRDAALFFRDFLTEDRLHRLIVTPTSSPENVFRTGPECFACLEEGCAMDGQILRELFTAVISASQVLENHDGFVPQVREMLEKLPPVEIGGDGCIREWMRDYELLEPGHRHMSHLFCLYPARQVSPEKTPELAAAARKSLEKRLDNGGGYTGWSRAWVIAFWARLRDGEQAHFHLQKLLTVSSYPNLFNRHPPFQIDGNFGSAAAMAELLVQAYDRRLDLLPALPAFWQNGALRGMAAPGQVTVDLSWKNGSLEKVRLVSRLDQQRTLTWKGKTLTLTLLAGQPLLLGPEDFR